MTGKTSSLFSRFLMQGRGERIVGRSAIRGLKPALAVRLRWPQTRIMPAQGHFPGAAGPKPAPGYQIPGPTGQRKRTGSNPRIACPQSRFTRRYSQHLAVCDSHFRCFVLFQTTKRRIVACYRRYRPTKAQASRVGLRSRPSIAKRCRKSEGDGRSSLLESDGSLAFS